MLLFLTGTLCTLLFNGNGKLSGYCLLILWGYHTLRGFDMDVAGDENGRYGGGFISINRRGVRQRSG